MGTPAERERRQQYVSDLGDVINFLKSGGYSGDPSLQAFTSTHGGNPLFKQFMSGGLNEVYGPQADPMKLYDVASGQFQWRIFNPDGSLKYPDWNPIPASELSSIRNFYDWRN